MSWRTVTFGEGDAVHKPRGYKFPGIVVAAFDTLGNETRYVVEMITFVEGRAKGSGLLHIFSGEQLARGFGEKTTT